MQFPDKISSLPKVSVCVVAYNHEKYIGQCLQSLVDQVTDFDYEIIVGEDCSKDGTRAIVERYVRDYPSKVRAIFFDKNVGAGANYLAVHASAVGEYIAHIDGDDYTLPGKLQAQADLLDAEPDCIFVWHRMRIESPSGKMEEGGPFYDDCDIRGMRFYRGDILQYISIGSNSSKMYRRRVRDFDIPGFDIVDYYINVEHVGLGYAKIIPSYYGVYRAGIGISSSGSATRLLLAKCFEHFSLKYPKHRARINAAALTYLIADFKNSRNSWRIFLQSWIKTFHPGSVFVFVRGYEFMRLLVRRSRV